MRVIALIAGVLLSLVAHAADVPSIPYEVIQRSEMGSTKLSMDVEVPLVDGQLPTADQIGEVSAYLVSREGEHERTFVNIYLPGMKVGGGAYATAHHTPEMRVQIMDYMLMQYPEYAQLLEQ